MEQRLFLFPATIPRRKGDELEGDKKITAISIPVFFDCTKQVMLSRLAFVQLV